MNGPDALTIMLDRLTKPFESCELHAYPDPGTGGEPWTCGWGQTGPDVTRDTVWPQWYADLRLENTASAYLLHASVLCPGADDNYRRAAVGDFAYNLGLTRLKASTLRRKINKGDWRGAVHEINRWVYAGGRRMRGLVLRRHAEGVLLMQ